MGYWTYLNLNVMFLIVYFKQNMDLKIQMLAGKGTKEFFQRFYKNLTSLVICNLFVLFLFLFCRTIKNFMEIGPNHKTKLEFQWLIGKKMIHKSVFGQLYFKLMAWGIQNVQKFFLNLTSITMDWYSALLL